MPFYDRSDRGAGDTPTSIGVIGLGYWGPNLARVVSESRRASLSWLCDSDPARLRVAGEKFPNARRTTDVADLFADEDLDAVLIATPVFSHFDLTRAALEAGLHALVEKPIAASAAQANELFELADERELTVMCGLTFLHSPPVIAIKKLLERGELGEIYFVSSSRVNLGLHQSDVSVLWDLGPHDFSILRYWFDECPTRISAMGRDSILDGIVDVAFVTLDFPSGTMANVEMSWLAPSKLRRTVLVGSEKMAVYEDGAAEALRVFDHGVDLDDPESFGEYQLSYRTGDVLVPQLDTAEPLASQVDTFISTLRSGDPIDSHADMCRDVLAMIETAEESLLDGGGPKVVHDREAFAQRAD